MRRFVWTDMDAGAQSDALARPDAVNDPALIASVRAIMDKRGRRMTASTQPVRRPKRGD